MLESSWQDHLIENLQTGDFLKAEAQLKEGVDINAPDPISGSLLSMAISRINEPEARWRAVNFLLEQGANPKLVDTEGFGPLFAAVIEQDTAVLRLLLDHGADPNREHDDEETLYDWAEFDYRYETYDCYLPEKPSDADRISEEVWLQFLDRLAIKNGRRRPDYLFLLRERGALKRAEKH